MGRVKPISLGLLVTALSSVSLLTAQAIAAAQEPGAVNAQACSPSVTDVTSPDPLPDACLPIGSQVQEIDAFDHFSWRMFVALIWPAKAGERGVANRAAKLDDPGTRVFETFKAEWELFGRTPSEWNQFDSDTPCGPKPDASVLVLASSTKLGALGQGGMGNLINALPSQSGKWVQYHTAFNKVTYEQIKDERLYDFATLSARKATGAPIQIKVGGVNIKSAWVEIPDPEARKKYYSRTALVVDPADPTSNKCRQTEVSLVGLHIVAQTERSKPNWTWSTFEHVDNVPEPDQKPMAFNSGDGVPMPAKDPNGGFPPKAGWNAPKLYNVQRVLDITKFTATTNQSYQTALSGVWRNYRLVMTHWPKKEANDLTSKLSIAQRMTPTLLSNLIAANPVFETFLPKSTCMACHEAAKKTSFIWALETHVIAHTSLTDSTENTKKLPLTDALKELRKFLENERKRMTTRRQ